jgi:hypothetical protein
MFNYSKLEAASPYWDRFLREGEELYNYMIKNILSMIHDNNMNHFDIKAGYSNLEVDCSIIIKEYGEDIKKELVKWIKQEYDNNILIDDQMWKPRRNACYDSEMSLAYRKLFQYKNYYFIVCLSYDCDIPNCEYCVNYINNNAIHFELILYGWEKDIYDKLRPSIYKSITSDNILLQGSKIN